MPNSRRSSSSQRKAWMLNSIVRDALVTSVMWRPPLLSFHTSHVSTVPNASLPASAREKAGPLLHHLAGAVVLQPLAEFGGPAVLPDDRVVDRLARVAVPENRRLTLIGDPDGGDVGGAELRPSERLDSHTDL